MPPVLSQAAFAVLAATCAPGIAPETLASLARVESGMNPLAIGVNGPGGGAVHVADASEAIMRAAALIGKGHSVDLGLMQIIAPAVAILNVSIRTLQSLSGIL